jgi:uncharacterized protein with PhoU and TrkA domain
MGGMGMTKPKPSKIDKYLIEMKDMTDLMVDLAYSAVLFNNYKIAEEVFAFEERMDKLQTEVERLALKSAVQDGNVEKAFVIIKLSEIFERIGDSALDIADVVLREILPHPVVKQTIEDSDTTIMRTKISGNSILVGKTLKRLELAGETGMWIIAIKRGKKWVFGPDGKNMLKPGDIVFARGPPDGTKHFHMIARGKARSLL